MLIFLNPLFLWALAAAAIPLVLHLLQRRKTTVTPFPTLKFLKMAQRKSSSRIKMENFLLWLLRTLLLAALAVAFAFPVLRQTKGAEWLTRARRDVIMVFDASYSMGYETDRGTVMEAAHEAAEAVLSTLAPSDRVSVFMAAGVPVPVIEKPTTEHLAVLQAVKALEWQSAPSDIAHATAMALSMLDREGLRGYDPEVFIFTDGQMQAWTGFEGAADGDGQAERLKGLKAERDAGNPSSLSASQPSSLPASQPLVVSREHRDALPMFVLMAGAPSPENAWVANVTVSPTLVLEGQDVKLSVVIGRTGGAKALTVSALVDDREVQTRSLTANAQTETPTELTLPGMPEGTYIVKVRLTVDALASDDEFLMVLRVRKQLPVLVAGSSSGTRFLRLALSPGGSQEAVTVVDPAELSSLDLAAYEAVYLADAFPLPGQVLLPLEKFVKAGGVVTVFPGNRAMPAAYDDFALMPAPVVAAEPVSVDYAARSIQRVSREDEIFRNFRFPENAAPTIALKKVLSFGEPHEEGSVVLTAREDQPFLLVRPAERGKVFFFAVSADRDWSTPPVTAFFVPVVHHILRHGAGASQTSLAVWLGTELPVLATVPNYRDGDRILAPSGREVAVRDGNGGELVLDPLSEPGVYTRIREGGMESDLIFAANARREESKLDMLTAGQIEVKTGFKKFRAAQTPEELMKVVDEFHNGRILGEPILWIVLILALLEWWYANRLLRKKTSLSDVLSIDEAGKVKGHT